MTTKRDLLKYIERLEQDIQSLRLMVEALDLEAPSTTPKHTPAKPVQVSTSFDTPEELLTEFFRAAQNTDDTVRDAILATILHSSITKHSPALDSFLRFSFKTLQMRWQDYLDNEDPSTFHITRTQRNDRGELSDLRMYLDARHRSPCPITFQQDPLFDMQWRIVSSSL